MATDSTSAAVIAIPSDVHAFTTNVSPRGVDLEGRLDLSLDALIKERKKEHKLLKKEEAKKLTQKPQSAGKRKASKQQKPQQQKQQQTTTKGGQKAQRKALVDKNRGLPTLSTAAKDKAVQGKTKTSIAATTAKLRRQMRADKTNIASSRLVVSPKALKGAKQNSMAQQSKKKKNTPQQARKVMSPTQPKSGKKHPVVKHQPNAQVKAPVRQVMRANNKKAKLSITITGQTNRKQKAATKVVLPGKLSQTRVSAAKKIVKRAKNRKAAAKVTKVVRQVPGQRKKK